MTQQSNASYNQYTVYKVYIRRKTRERAFKSCGSNNICKNDIVYSTVYKDDLKTTTLRSGSGKGNWQLTRTLKYSDSPNFHWENMLKWCLRRHHCSKHRIYCIYVLEINIQVSFTWKNLVNRIIQSGVSVMPFFSFFWDWTHYDKIDNLTSGAIMNKQKKNSRRKSSDRESVHLIKPYKVNW